jgi:uncharacterized protein
MNLERLRSLALIAALLWLPAFASGKATGRGPLDHLPALSGDYFPLHSAATGRDYHIFVRLPEGYEATSSASYPVVYILDGDSLFPLLAPTHLFLTYDEQLPEAILVGIAYGGFGEVNKRSIDFTAPADDAAAGRDGAPRFLDFMKDGLIPTIEQRFRADPARRVLLGQSRGGYFVLWSALQAPDLFWGRISSNPVFTPGRDRFFEASAPSRASGLRIAIASGTRDTEQAQQDARQWLAHWSAPGVDAPWEVRVLAIENGTHAASIGEAYRQAMLWLFDEDVRRAKYGQE